MYSRCLIFLILLSSCPAANLLYAEEAKALRMITVADSKQARNIRQQLVKGASFSALAAEKSLGPERQSWGYSGIVRLADVQPALRSVLEQLRPGKISKVIELGRQYIIVKVISPQIERYYEVADRASAQKKTEEAVKALQAALRLEQDSIETYLKLAGAYNYARRYEDALPYLDKAYEYAPQSTHVAMLRSAVYTNAAVTTKNRAYADKALQGYKNILQTSPRLAPAAHFGMGKVYLAVLQQPQKAIDHLEKAVEHTPNAAGVYESLIQAHYDLKQYDKAWDYLRLAQTLGFDFPGLKDALQDTKR